MDALPVQCASKNLGVRTQHEATESKDELADLIELSERRDIADAGTKHCLVHHLS